MSRLSARNFHYALGLFAVLTIIYGVVLPRAVTLEDSGEFLFLARNFGHAHPPGYSFSVALSYLWNSLGGFSVAVNVHLFNALLAAAGAAMLAHAAMALTGAILGPCIVFLVLGVSPLWMSLATTADVYPLFFLTSALGLSFALSPRGARATTAAWFCWGLAMAAHWPLFVFAAPAFLLVGLGRDRVRALCAFVLGATPLLLIFVPSEQSVLGPVTNFNEAWNYLNRSSYSAFEGQGAAGWIDDFRFLRDFTGTFVAAYSPLGVILLIAGFAALIRAKKYREALAFFLLLFANTVLLRVFTRMEFNILTRDLYRSYAMLPLAIGGLVSVYGVLFVGRLFPARGGRAWIVATVFALVGWSALRSPDRWTPARKTFARAAAELYLRALPENALVLVRGDADLGPLLYTHAIDGVRADVELVSQNGFLLRPVGFKATGPAWLETFVPWLLAELARGRSAFFIQILPELRASLANSALDVKDHGLLKEISLPGKSRGLQLEKETLTRFANDFAAGRFAIGQQWEYYREALLGPVCRSLLAVVPQHEIYSRSVYCEFFQILARKQAGAKIPSEEVDAFRARAAAFPADEVSVFNSLLK